MQGVLLQAFNTQVFCGGSCQLDISVSDSPSGGILSSCGGSCHLEIDTLSTCCCVSATVLVNPHTRSSTHFPACQSKLLSSGLPLTHETCPRPCGMTHTCHCSASADRSSTQPSPPTEACCSAATPHVARPFPPHTYPHSCLLSICDEQLRQLWGTTPLHQPVCKVPPICLHLSSMRAD